MMARVSDVVVHWLGLCRKAPVFHPYQAVFADPPEPAYEEQPGGGGGPGSIRRGIGAAFSGIRTLNRNRQLLWFTLFIGLVLAGTTICQGALFYIGWIMSDEVLLRPVLSFLIEFSTVFCMVLLFAGLVRSIALKKEGAASFTDGFSGIRIYLKPLIAWSFILAVAGMLLSRIFFYPGGLFPWFNPVLTGLLIQYPFTLNLNPTTFAEVPGYGGRSPLFWTYPYGFENALGFFAINLLLLILTVYVIPLIVLEQKTIREAVAGSFAMLKKTWAGTAACAIFLGAIVYGVFLTYTLVQAAHGMVTPPSLLYDRPTPPWFAIALLYYLVLFGVAFVMATAGGIAVLDLFRQAKNQEGA